MRKATLTFVLMVSAVTVFAENEIKPEGEKLIWFLIVPIVAAGLFFIFRKKDSKTKREKKPLFQKIKVSVEIEKDKVYYPDNLKLTIRNTGNTDVDLDKPLLIFDNFWLQRKFRLKGTNNYLFYPLYLEKGKSHTLQIDLNRFYLHDKKLKKFPKAKVKLFAVNGKLLGRKSVYLRKTLFKF